MGISIIEARPLHEFRSLRDRCNLIQLRAFGARALKIPMTPDLTAIFDMGVGCRVYHALAPLIMAIVSAWRPDRRLPATSGLLFIGDSVVLESPAVFAATESQLP